VRLVLVWLLCIPPLFAQPVRRLLDRPVEITSPCGWRADPISGRLRRHRGVDIRAQRGEVVYAPVAGLVVQAGNLGEGMGISVSLRHEDGSRSIYGHLDDCEAVQVGSFVPAGASIGHVGSTGHSTGPHLHFEIADSYGVVRDPQQILKNLGIAASPAGNFNPYASGPQTRSRHFSTLSTLPAFHRLASLGNRNYLPGRHRLVTASLLQERPCARHPATATIHRSR
jgi:murein DD-endopeptidase MepM/ murein hydrolase activator NlpD